jgi:hypothetical protein
MGPSTATYVTTVTSGAIFKRLSMPYVVILKFEELNSRRLVACGLLAAQFDRFSIIGYLPNNHVVVWLRVVEQPDLT